MIDYWSKLKLNEAWSKKERFNYIMNYIDEKTGNAPSEEDIPVEPEITAGKINVTVKNESGNTVANADVSVYDKGLPFETTTDNNGKCTIDEVPYGTYTIEAVAEGYEFTVESITINSPETSKTIILKQEADDDV